MNKILILMLLLLAYSANAQISLNIDIKTGDDDLRPADFQKDPELVVVLRDRREIRKENISRGQVWPSNSIRRVTVELPEGVGLADLSELLLHRESTAGRRYIWDYLEKDNWTVKALKVTAVYRENGISRSFVLLDLIPRGNVFRFVYDPTTRRGEGQVYRQSLVPTAATFPPRTTTRNATLTVTLGTGVDDLRGRGDNVSITLRLGGSPLTINLENLNGGLRLANNSERTFTKEIPNSSTLNIDTISEVVVRHEGGGSNDEWVLNKVQVVIKKTVPVSGTPEPGIKDEVVEKTRLLVNQNYPSIHRFTSRSRQKSFLATADQTALRNATITAVFTTGDDDLRGGGDNVDLVIRFKSGRGGPIRTRNLNNGANWGGYSTHTIRNKELLGSYDVDINDIESIELRHTGGGGLFADNWNLAAFKLTITKDGRTRELVDEVKRLIHRFTGESRSKIFSLD